MPYTVQKLLSSNLKGLRLVSGRAAVENIISNVNMIDNPDSFDWFQHGDFLITTGFVFQDDENVQNELVRRLCDIGCAGLGIKTKRFFAEIPENMIAEAERLGFPIVELPIDYSLAQVANLIRNELSDSNDSLIKQHLKIHERLINCSLSGGDLKDISEQLVELLDNPVVVLDEHWQLLEYAEPENAGLRLDELFQIDNGKMILPASLLDQLPEDFASYRKSIRRSMDAAGDSYFVEILPVRVDYVTYGYIVCPMINHVLTRLDLLALEQAITIIALERIKTLQFEDYKRRIRFDFFDDLLDGRIDASMASRHLADMHGMDTNRPHLLMIVRIKDSQEQALKDMLSRKARTLHYLRALSQQVNQFCASRSCHATVLQRGQQVIVFLLLPRGEEDPYSNDSIRAFVSDLYDDLSSLSGMPQILMGVGRMTKSVHDFSRSFQEAQEAVRIQEATGRTRDAAWYQAFKVYQLLESVESKALLREFHSASVGRLQAYDLKNKSNFMEVLEAYVATSGNVSKAADRLFMHRNTILYRIRKIEEIMKIDLKEWDKILEVHLALHIARLLKEQ